MGACRGQPFGFTSSVTSGISKRQGPQHIKFGWRPPLGRHRKLHTDRRRPQQRQFRGALVNLKGEPVGINTAIYSQTGTYAGCSFAIPVSIVQKVVKDLKDFGTVQRIPRHIVPRAYARPSGQGENQRGAVAASTWPRFSTARQPARPVSSRATSWWLSTVATPSTPPRCRRP